MRIYSAKSLERIIWHNEESSTWSTEVLDSETKLSSRFATLAEKYPASVICTILIPAICEEQRLSVLFDVENENTELLKQY